MVWSSHLLVLFSFLACFGIKAQKDTFRCPPCASDCHRTDFEESGNCPICNMPLIKVNQTLFEGYDKKEVMISNDSILLNAAYYTPKNKNRIKGAMIVVHGSAPSRYEDMTYYTKIGTKLNMAVLAYDKRGVGKSEGNYQFFNVEESENWFNLLASDVLACLSWIKKQPELQKTKIGLIGGSQAGWIMPLAASKNKNIDFIIIGEGVAVSAGEEHYFSQLTGDGDESVNKLSIAEAHLKLQKFNGTKGFDPRNILKGLKAKTLWILGTHDPVIPVDATLHELQSMNNPNFHVQILENGDHNFNNTQTGKPYNLLEFIEPWLLNNDILN
ncbi:S9 family peptidase [Flagellimonas sp. CMM7]|uniref:alpha/beta hydrolase family protein n=1 Tax=Flagellimonas sp. CMM7 TaxID=2654676 RepID=UPI0013D8C239|nr:prolyl oligopeptidase family serine peptidase [Flagellimonas sp. CMM7]UII80623.1 prolyl oligopeptidase family serine peptidase [Flagellimonas sp. CMM7]